MKREAKQRTEDILREEVEGDVGIAWFDSGRLVRPHNGGVAG